MPCGQMTGHRLAVRLVDVAAVLELGPYVGHPDLDRPDRAQPRPVLDRIDAASAKMAENIVNTDKAIQAKNQA